MSVAYRPVQWNAFKLGYDAGLLVLVAAYVTTYERVSRIFFTGAAALSQPILAMRAWGSCAFLLLSLVLCIGPLARLDARFLPLLYNRRHAGVVMAAVALVHAFQVLGFYYAWGRRPALEALLSYDLQVTSASLPFVTFGIGALALILVLALTSHDFWQKFLGPTLWKSTHMLVYLAYAGAVVHVAFGPWQREGHPAFRLLSCALVLCVCTLHVLAARRSQDPPESRRDADGWIDVGDVSGLADGHARAFCPPTGERIALVRKGAKLFALAGVCAHQRGPLYEGRIKDGCLTCPWHGWQYQVEDGRSPPPFQEKLATFRLRMKNGRVLIDPRAMSDSCASEAVEPFSQPQEQATHA